MGGGSDRQPVRRFRDPIHGFIKVYKNEMAVIDDPVFQRLRRIKQLSFAHLVYHGAEHSRFGHVLGTMHLAGRVLESIRASPEKSGDGESVDDEDIRTVRMAALLHDVGHRPFSHALDPVFEETHEELSEALVMGRFAHVIDKGPDGVDPQRVADLIRGQQDGQKPFLTDLVSGQLDVDKMDYLLRDSHYAGVKYGAFDLDMLVDSLVLVGKSLAVSLKGIMSVVQLLLARYYMFGQVYDHKTKRVFECMLQLVARRLSAAGALEYPSAASLRDGAGDLVNLDDGWLMKVLASAKDEATARIGRDIMAREPFTEVVSSEMLVNDMPPEDRIGYFAAIGEFLETNLESTGLELHDIILDKHSVLPYRLLPYGAAGPLNRVMIYDAKSGQSAPIEQRSQVVRSIARHFAVHRIFARRSKADDLRQYLQKTYPGTYGSQ